MVPSTGFATALYATSTPACKPSANCFVSIVSVCSNAAQKPRKSCDKITPEFPRAPINNPFENAFKTNSIDGDSSNC